MTIESTNDKLPTTPAITYSECYQQPFVSLYNEDCIETMKRIPDGSIDLMLTDMPYGRVNCEWDIKPNLQLMWPEWERILSNNGVWVFTAMQPLTSELVLSRLGFFKYELIWEKAQGTGHLDANKKPLRKHENILVFCKKGYPKYNIIKQPSNKPNKGKSKSKVDGNVYRKNISGTTWVDDNQRFPTSVLYFENDSDRYNTQKINKGIHPTQKPLDLFRWLLLTYSNKGETVFDGYSGSGTTAEACIIEGRKFIGSELNKEYFYKSVLRLKNVPTQLF